MNDQKNNQEAIQPLAFTPLEHTAGGARFRLKPLTLILGFSLLVSVLVLAFLLSARSVVVQISPDNAVININGGISFALADHYLMRPGDYQLVAEAKGFQPLQKPFTVGPEDHQLLKLEMQKLPGHLAITTEPEAAIVSINDQAVGTTPLTIHDLKPGIHSLSLSADRYLSSTREISIEGMDITQSLAVQLEPAWGQVSLTSSPPGATVSIGDEVRGTTPITTELLAEGEVVKVALQGYKTWQQSLRVAIGDTLDVSDIQLEPADGVLRLSSSPSGATVTLNGTYQGTTPLDIELTPQQSHLLTLFYNGYKTAKRNLTLSAGEQQSMSVQLQASLGEVQVVASPGDASVWIDGVLRGTQGQTFTLPARQHHIELRRPGYATATRTVTPQPGLDQVVKVTLLTDQQARWASIPEKITTANGASLLLFKPTETFTMGAPRRESGRRANEVRRKVQLTRPFYLASHEVTNRQYKQFSRAHSSSHTGGITLDQPSQPVVRISWEEAARYCNWLSGKDNLTPFYREESGKIKGYNPSANGYRLPTEAEWAWAARAITGGEKRFSWGQQFPPANNSGNFADSSAGRLVTEKIKGYTDGFAVSAPVGSFRPNHRQLYDLEGNVSEWVNDYYGIELGLSGNAEKDPTGPATGDLRVIRGASWRHGNITELRLSYRDYGEKPRDDVGFRIARYVE
ncbi:MAG: PEGA domain-containing protein [Gammaproteobacteria bacterium]|nr:MAG: PEGA domain-containing protein [Gammaproteobacteria bacterium]